MILEKVVWDYQDLKCHYRCSQCGEKFDGTYRLPTYCPTCGRLLDKNGKPGLLRDPTRTSVALAFIVIKNGLLKDPLPKVTQSGEGWNHVYSCTGEPAEPETTK